jgi:hypothetical protein
MSKVELDSESFHLDDEGLRHKCIKSQSLFQGKARNMSIGLELKV